MTVAALLLDVLFIGHSLVGPTMPRMLQDAVAAAGGRGQVEAQIINGAPLGYNWQHGAGAEGVDARARLPSGDIGVLVMTEGLPLGPVHEFWQTEEYAAEYARLALAANPTTQVYIYETWHSILSGTGADLGDDPGQDIPWRTRLEADLAVWQGIAEGVTDRLPEGAPPVRLIAAGQAMGMLHDRIEAGQVPGLDDISDVFADDIHLNDLGTYFLTMVQFASIYGLDPDPLPDALGGRPGPTPAQADVFQDIAWQVAQDFAGPAGD